MTVFTLSSHWLLVRFTFVLNGCWDYFQISFGFTTLNRKALYMFVVIAAWFISVALYPAKGIYTKA